MRFWNKIRSRFGRGVDAALAEEIRLHRALLDERFRAEGLGSAEAGICAAREFGPMAAALESSRAEWTVVWLESFWIDVPYAVRALFRSKTFAAAAVPAWDTLALVLGVGLAGAATTLAALGPASRAARLDPNRILRADD